MTTLVDSLRLTLLSNRLNHDEWSQLTTKLTSSFGRAFILNAIKSLQSNDFKSVISMIKEIIYSREEISSEPFALANIQCIDQLSSGLIGNIATYLTAKEYGRFEQSNRCLYISCNTPNKLQTINLSNKNVACYSTINLFKYSPGYYLQLDYEHTNKLNIPSNVNNVSNLCLTTKCGSGYSVLTKKCIQFVSKFQSIQRLSMYHLKLNSVDNNNILLDILPPNVTQLGVGSGSFMPFILKFYATQITKLWCPNINDLNVIANNIQFPALTYVNIRAIDRENGGIDCMKHIVSNAPKLRTFRCGWLSDIEHFDHFRQVLKPLMIHKTLEYVTLSVSWFEFSLFCDALHSFLLSKEEIIGNRKMNILVDMYSKGLSEQLKAELVTTFKTGFMTLCDVLKLEDFEVVVDIRHDLDDGITKKQIEEIVTDYLTEINVCYNSDAF
eukprot:75477_1